MTHLKVGDKAPAFKGINQFEELIDSKDFKGKKIILFFYPKDSTPACTAEACNLRDHFKELTDLGFLVIGVSMDSPKRHLNFISKNKLPYHLIADENKILILKYGVWGWKKFMGREFEGILRTTFIINVKGIIENIITKVNTKNHFEQIMSLY